MRNIRRFATALLALALALACVAAGAESAAPFFSLSTVAPTADPNANSWLFSPTATPAATIPVVRASALTNVLSGPGAAYPILGTLQPLDELLYLNEARVDEQGVIWYKAQYYSLGEGWVSSAESAIALSDAASVAGIVPTTGNFAVALNGEAHVRTAPGNSFGALTAIPLGGAATYLNQYTTDEAGVIWYYVSYNGIAGWVSSAASTLRDTVIGFEATAAPTPAPTPTPAPPAVKATGGSTNLRSGPGLGYSVLTAMNQNAVATYLNNSSVDDRGVTWYNVSFYGVTGWVSSRYTSLGDWPLSNGDAPAASAYSYVEGTSGNSNLRTGPGLSYDDVGTLHKGETATYLNEQSTDDRGVVWYKVKFEGKTCWVSSKYTKLRSGSASGSASGSSSSSSSGSSGSGRTVTGKSGNSNLRSGPGLSYDDVGTLHKGESATYLNEQSTDDRGVVWYKVKFEGKTCWVSSKYTKLN